MNKLFIVTDVEPDDFLAIIMVIEHFIKTKTSFKNLLICSSLMNANKKKLIIKKLLESYNIKDDIVFSGYNGLKPEYKQEGVNILTENERKIERIENEIYEQFVEFTTDSKIDILMLANPVTISNLLKGYENNVNKIYIMGGHFNNNCSYNFSINMKATTEFFDWVKKFEKECFIYSSHMFAANYNGYYNEKKFPDVIKTIFSSKKKSIEYFRKMMENWDSYMCEDKSMISRIGKENIGRQFAPADVICSIGYLFGDKIELKKQKLILNLKILKWFMMKILTRVIFFK